MAIDSSALGTVRLGNKRQNSPLKPRADETVIDIDRTHPILGNPFILKDHRNDAQRTEVIARYEQKYHADIGRHGPMARATENLAERVKGGENLILMCWCAPRPCHGQSVMRQIAELIERRPEVKASSPPVQTTNAPYSKSTPSKPDFTRAAREIEAFGPPPGQAKVDPSPRNSPLSHEATGEGKRLEASDKSRNPTSTGTDLNPYSTPGLR